MNYLDELSGVNRNGDSKSILTIKNQSEDVNIIGPVIIVNERAGYAVSNTVRSIFNICIDKTKNLEDCESSFFMN